MGEPKILRGLDMSIFGLEGTYMIPQNDAYIINLINYIGDDVQIDPGCNFSWGDLVSAVQQNKPVICRHRNTVEMEDNPDTTDYVLTYINWYDEYAIFSSVKEVGFEHITILSNGACGRKFIDLAEIDDIPSQTLIVTINDDGIASKNAAEIYQKFYIEGINVQLNYGGMIYNINCCSEDTAHFTSINDDTTAECIIIDSEGTVESLPQYYVSTEYFEQKLGNIDSILDDIIEIQNNVLIPNGDEVSY